MAILCRQASTFEPGIDPVGSCIGIRGNRIQSIVNELQGEKIDIVSWDEEPRAFISNALSPSEPVHVELLEQDQTAIVVVPDRQLSLAIGKEGQNTRLAARLTGWRLDIKGMTEWEEMKEKAQAAAAQATAAAVEVEEEPVDAADAVEEASAIVEEAQAAAVEGAEIASVPEPVTAEAVLEQPEAATPVEILDEDSILEALIREEEVQTEAPTETAEVSSLSVQDLDAFTLDDVEMSDDDDDDEEDFEDVEEGDQGELADLPVLIPDAGKIRFAEDIVEDFRGGGRRRRGGGGALVDFRPLKGKRCLIIGGRQSAFEWTALLNEAGAAAVHVSHRHDSPAFAEADWSWINPLVDAMVDNPGWFRNLSPEEKDEVNHRLWAEGRLKVEPWLESRVVKETVKLWPNTQVVSCDELPGGDLVVRLDNGESLTVDHVILATGYKVKIDQVPLLAHGNILHKLMTRNGYPVLDEHFQTNIPGLFITSMTAAQDFGPFFAFTISVRTSAKLIGQAIVN